MNCREQRTATRKDLCSVTTRVCFTDASRVSYTHTYTPRTTVHIILCVYICMMLNARWRLTRHAEWKTVSLFMSALCVSSPCVKPMLLLRRRRRRIDYELARARYVFVLLIGNTYNYTLACAMRVGQALFTNVKPIISPI